MHCEFDGFGIPLLTLLIPDRDNPHGCGLVQFLQQRTRCRALPLPGRPRQEQQSARLIDYCFQTLGQLQILQPPLLLRHDAK